jgi:hypothetical protein
MRDRHPVFLNRYFRSREEIVHFYNTHDVLPRGQTNDPGEGTTCWPAPETTANMNKIRIGQLGLSDAEKDTIVNFMRTVSDGYCSRDARYELPWCNYKDPIDDDPGRQMAGGRTFSASCDTAPMNTAFGSEPGAPALANAEFVILPSRMKSTLIIAVGCRSSLVTCQIIRGPEVNVPDAPVRCIP